jgi:hypothetical protein
MLDVITFPEHNKTDTAFSEGKIHISPLSPDDDDYMCLSILEVRDMLDHQCYRCQSMLYAISLSS